MFFTWRESRFGRSLTSLKYQHGGRRSREGDGPPEPHLSSQISNLKSQISNLKSQILRFSDSQIQILRFSDSQILQIANLKFEILYFKWCNAEISVRQEPHAPWTDALVSQFPRDAKLITMIGV